MKIKCGIIGLPNVGKSTLFNIITKSNVKNKNFPFCTIKSNNKNIKIYDNKIYKILKITNSKKITLPKIEYIDIAGLIKGANKGLGLGNKFLEDIKKTNILLHVIRIFNNINITNINKNINPIRDIKIINKEIIKYDIKQLKKLKKKYKNINNIKKINKYINKLKKNNNIKIIKNNIFKKINLISNKKHIYILNINNKKKNKYLIKKTKKYLNNKKNIIIINIKKLNKNKKKNYIKINNKIIKKIIKLLNLIYFFTTNKKETKKIILKKNTNIIYAANKIHSDFSKKFIKAKITNYKKFIKYKGWNNLKQKGKIKIKGKKYKIKNNDIIYFLIKK